MIPDHKYFRGKGLHDGYWHYGGYVLFERVSYCFDVEAPADNVSHRIIPTVHGDWGLANHLESVEVDPETVGQFTGFWDKNKHMIFEGDLLEWCGLSLPVVWDQKNAKFAVDWEGRLDTLVFDETFARECEVKGNIYEQ